MKEEMHTLISQALWISKMNVSKSRKSLMQITYDFIYLILEAWVENG